MKFLFVYADGLNEKVNEQIESAIEDLDGRNTYDIAGIEATSENVVGMGLLKWADITFVFEKWHRDELFRQFPEAVTQDVRLLDILTEDLEERSLIGNILKRNLR
jgi:predicted protein tyrosine phosphatase